MKGAEGVKSREEQRENESVVRAGYGKTHRQSFPCQNLATVVLWNKRYK